MNHPKRAHTLAKGIGLLAVAALLAALAGLGAPGAAAPTAAAAPAPGHLVSPAGLLNPDGTLDLSSGFQGTLDLRGWEVTLDGERGPVLKPASRPAAQVTAWSALPNQGLNGTVIALAVSGSDLYVGGGFTATGDGALANLGRIARYNTATGWSALPNQGLNDVVRALAVSGSDLYVGGLFTATGDGTLTNLGYIARYNTTSNTWNALSNQGLNGPAVYALAVSGSDLYVGGSFTQTGDGTLTNLGRIARYNTTTNTWSALSNQGLNGQAVFALAVSGSDLYVGGLFTATGDGTLTNLGRIARYNTATNTWSALSNQGLNGAVRALAVSGSDLYVGGGFTATGDGTTLTNLGRIARYNTATGWSALPNQGLNGTVIALAVSGSDLYVGGGFTATGDGALANLGRIARYNTTTNTWSALPTQGLNSTVIALAVSGSDLYVGGEFTATGDGTLTNLGYIVRGSLQQPPQVQPPGAGVAPEASTLFLLGSGLAGLGAYARLRWRGRRR